MTMTRDRILLSILGLLLVLGLGGFFWFSQDDGDTGFGEPAKGDASSELDGGSRGVERQPGHESGNKTTDGTTGLEETDGYGNYQPKESGLGGFVHDSEGLPISGAIVALCLDITDLAGVGRQGEILQHLESDAEGKFLFKKLSDTQTYILRIDKEGFAGKFISGLELPFGDRKDVDVLLDQGYAIKGQVRDLNGSPVVGAVVEVRDVAVRVADARLAIERRALTGSDGRYLIENVSPGFKDISAVASSFATKTRNRTAINRATVERDLDFELGPGASIRGRVVDTADQGIAGVAIRAQSYDARGRRMGQFLPPVYSDESGNFSYDGLEAGDYILVPEKRGWYSASMRDFGRAGSGEVLLRMKRNPVIRGQVVDADTGAPLRRFSLYSTPRPSLLFVAEASKQKFDSGDGSFEFLCTRNSGDVYLNVAADGYASGQSQRIDLNGITEITDIRIQADRGAIVTGRIVNGRGEGIGGAEVTLEAAIEGEEGLGGLGKMIYAQNRLLRRSVTTDSQGRFEADRVRLGDYRISVRHPTHADELGEKVHQFSRTGEQSIGEIRLAEGGTLGGVAYELDGSLLKNVLIRLKPEDLSMSMPRSFETETDAEGGFEFSHMPAGSYRLEVIRTSAMHHRMGGLPGAPDGKHILVHVAEGGREKIEVRGL